ncbi:hypothetical protein SAMN05660845_1347 [Flavobacterium swingsii]|uniref:Uncharacterized protein n=2 Tax=Flavobacterium swingsii TaxID=498292 RepID=A0A1I0XQ05_9FLAO|nr:hypothetical protein SAMN05660845_1347 [Flavobacterium swingsii]
MSSCFLSDWDVRLVLMNKTNHKIRYIEQLKNKKDFIPNSINCEIDELNYINSNDKKIIRFHNKWDVYFKNHPNELLRIYIIDEDSLMKYGTCKILKQQIFLNRYDLTYEDLVKLNWRVVCNEKD